MEAKNKALELLKKYFKETPREQILKDWSQAEKETKDIESPTVEEFMLCIIGSPFYCKSEIEGTKLFYKQCEHCKEYYKLLESNL